MNILNRKLEFTLIATISFAFIVWSGAFIYKSSFIAIDGKRYFCLFDDAMVSMRYAWNFSHGQGLVYNAGQYVQGYTNLLMVLLMTSATFIFDKSTADLVIQILGLCFMLTIACVNMQISDYFVESQSQTRRRLVRILAFLCALSYYPLIYWSLVGMETGLLTMLLLMGILIALHYTRTRNPNMLLVLAVCLGLAYLTRNDSVIFSIIIWLYIVVDIYESKSGRKGLVKLLPAVGIFMLTIIAEEIFQYKYYGEWVPNTYTLKLTGVPLSFRISDGIGFVTPFLFETGLVLALTTIDILLNFRRQKMLLFSMFLAAVGYQVYVGGDPWNYWRIMSPSMPLLLLLLIVAITTIVDALLANATSATYVLRFPVSIRTYFHGGLIALLVLLGLISINTRFWQEGEISLRTIYEADSNKRNVNSALVVDTLTRSDATVGLTWAGSVPYFSDRTAIDMLGKTDRYIAHLPPDLSGSVSRFGMKSLPGHNKYDLNYSIIKLQPTYVQAFKWGNQDLTKWAENTYVSVTCDRILISLLKDSPAVNWDKITKGKIYHCS